MCSVRWVPFSFRRFVSGFFLFCCCCCWFWFFLGLLKICCDVLVKCPQCGTFFVSEHTCSTPKKKECVILDLDHTLLVGTCKLHRRGTKVQELEVRYGFIPTSDMFYQDGSFEDIIIQFLICNKPHHVRFRRFTHQVLTFLKRNRRRVFIVSRASQQFVSKVATFLEKCTGVKFEEAIGRISLARTLQLKTLPLSATIPLIVDDDVCCWPSSLRECILQVSKFNFDTHYENDELLLVVLAFQFPGREIFG